MEPILIIRPEIALTISFYLLSSSLFLLFGLFYVAIYTLVKMEKIKKMYIPFAYIFGFYKHMCMYFVADKIQSK